MDGAVTVASDYGEKRTAEALQFQGPRATRGAGKADNGRHAPPQCCAGTPSFRCFSCSLSCNVLALNQRLEALIVVLIVDWNSWALVDIVIIFH